MPGGGGGGGAAYSAMLAPNIRVSHGATHTDVAVASDQTARLFSTVLLHDAKIECVITPGE